MPDIPQKILVIDDEPMIRQVFTAFLQQWGYQALEAENGRQGVALFERERADVVLTDLDMPEMSGLEVLAYIHDRSPDTPVVIISGVGQLDDAVQSVKLGAWDYLTKPIGNMAVLENTISRCLERVRLVRENKMYQRHLEDEVARKTEELRRKNIALGQEVIERKQQEEEVCRLNAHLEEIVDASGRLFMYTTVRDLLAGVLRTMHRLLRVNMGRISQEASAVASSFAALREDEQTRLICGEGVYSHCDGCHPSAVLPEELEHRLSRILRQGASAFSESDYLGYLRSSGGVECILYLDNCTRVAEADRRLLRIYLNNIASAIDAILLQEEIINTQKEVVITLGEVIETRSQETANHVRRVAEYSYLLAKKYGLSEQEARLLRFASPMHDAGKIGIPDAVLNKPGKLTSDETHVMHGHTTMGFDILRKSQREILKIASIVAHEHHERWDGSGYPRGLAGENIHIFGRIVALADVFDALGTARCYKAAWPLDQVLAKIRHERGAHFDPRLVDLLFDFLPDFLEVRELYPES